MFEVQELAGKRLAGPFETYYEANHVRKELLIPHRYDHDTPITSSNIVITPIDPKGVWTWNRKIPRWRRDLPPGAGKFFKGLLKTNTAGALVLADWLDEHNEPESAIACRLIGVGKTEFGNLLVSAWSDTFAPSVSLIYLSSKNLVSCSVTDLQNWRAIAEKIVSENLLKAYA